MGFTPQSGQVGIRTQPTKGLYQDPGAAAPAGIFFRTRQGALNAKRTLLVPDAEIGGNRDVPDAYLDSVIWAGQYDFYLRLEAAATLLYAALGAKSSTFTGVSTAQVGTHVITPQDALPWLSVEEAIANGYEVFNYTDVVVNTLHLEVDNGYASGTVGVIALKQTAGNVKTAVPHWDPSNLIVGSNVTVTYNSLVLPAKKWSIDINNNVEENDFRLGSITAADATPKRREVTMGVTTRPTDSGLWRRAVYGSSAATVAGGGAASKSPVQILMSTYENIGTSTTKYSLQIDAPSAAIAPYDNKVSGDNVMESDFNINLYRPDNTVGLMTATVKNGLAAVA